MKKFLILFVVISIFSLLSIALFLKLHNNTDSTSPSPLVPDNNPIIDTNLPTIILDAGHGGEDGGAVGKNGAYEKDINLIITKKLKERLDESGIPCVLTRSTDVLLYDKNADYEGKKKRLDLLARKEFAESYDNAIFISIHQNSYPKEQYSGFQAYYSANEPTSRTLALSIEDAVKTTLQPKNNRKSKQADSSIYLLDKLYCPAILLECGFISNAEECNRLCDEKYQESLCDAIINGIKDFLK